MAQLLAGIEPQFTISKPSENFLSGLSFESRRKLNEIFGLISKNYIARETLLNSENLPRCEFRQQRINMSHTEIFCCSRQTSKYSAINPKKSPNKSMLTFVYTQILHIFFHSHDTIQQYSKLEPSSNVNIMPFGLIQILKRRVNHMYTRECCIHT